jgi:hypothetical protein
LPFIELLGGVAHVVFFIMILVALVVLSPRTSASFVFTQFVNGGGWQSDGVSWCIGLLTVVYCFVGKCPVSAAFVRELIFELGFDGAIHMSKSKAIAASAME